MTAWTAAALGVGTAALDTWVWAAAGGGTAPQRYAWQLVLAVLLAGVTLTLCRGGFPWPRRDPRPPPGPPRCAQPPLADRLLHLVASTALDGTLAAAGLLLAVVAAHRRARVAAIYQRLEGKRDDSSR